MTKQVKFLLIIMGAVFLFQQLLGVFYADEWFNSIFGLNHAGLFGGLRIWQPFTYMFLHGGWFHLLFNGIALWMFGGELERFWGAKRFMRYFLLSGLGAGLCIAAMNFFIYYKYNNGFSTTIGASGAIFALLLAYGMTWPNREILIMLTIPVKTKYVVIIYGLFEFFGTLSTITGQEGRISHVAHFGGLVAGFLLLKLGSAATGSSTLGTASPQRGSFLSEQMKKRRLDKKRVEIETRKKAKNIIDKMLEKIAESGLESLSPEEKRDLEWARKNFYPGGSDIIH